MIVMIVRHISVLRKSNSMPKSCLCGECRFGHRRCRRQSQDQGHLAIAGLSPIQRLPLHPHSHYNVRRSQLNCRTSFIRGSRAQEIVVIRAHCGCRRCLLHSGSSVADLPALRAEPTHQIPRPKAHTQYVVEP